MLGSRSGNDVVSFCTLGKRDFWHEISTKSCTNFFEFRAQVATNERFSSEANEAFLVKKKLNLPEQE